MPTSRIAGWLSDESPPNVSFVNSLSKGVISQSGSNYSAYSAYLHFGRNPASMIAPEVHPQHFPTAFRCLSLKSASVMETEIVTGPGFA
jgi:hypothetical protein